MTRSVAAEIDAVAFSTGAAATKPAGLLSGRLPGAPGSVEVATLLVAAASQIVAGRHNVEDVWWYEIPAEAVEPPS